MEAVKKEKRKSDWQMLDDAEKAMRNAIAKVVEAHRRTGEPLVIWRDGKVVLLPPDQLAVHESPAPYRHRARSKI